MRIGAADHDDAGGNLVIAGVVPGKQLGQGMLIEFAQGDEHGVRRRTGINVPFHQVESRPGEGALEPIGTGRRLTREQNPGPDGLCSCLPAHAPQRSE